MVVYSLKRVTIIIVKQLLLWYALLNKKEIVFMTPKKIAVLGGGNGAHTMAAEFALKGHTVNLFLVFSAAKLQTA